MKKMLAIAVAAAFAAPALSMADTTLYGILKAELVSTKTAAGAKNSDLQDNGSRIGIKGSTPLNNGMAATYVMEYHADLEGDTTAGAKGFGTTRQTYVGLKSNVGEFRFGKQWGPTKLSSGKAEMFGDQLGDYNSSGALGSDTEAAISDAVTYVNKFGNVGVALAMSNSGANGVVSTSGSGQKFTDGMINYSNNGVYVALGHQDEESGRDTTRLTGAYKFPAGHKVGAVYQQVKPATGAKEKAYVISGGYKMGNSMIKAQFGQNDNGAGTKKKHSAIGYDYSLGKKTKIFAEYAKGSNGGTINGAGTPEKGFGMGIVHSF